MYIFILTRIYLKLSFNWSQFLFVISFKMRNKTSYKLTNKSMKFYSNFLMPNSVKIEF